MLLTQYRVLLEPNSLEWKLLNQLFLNTQLIQKIVLILPEVNANYAHARRRVCVRVYVCVNMCLCVFVCVCVNFLSPQRLLLTEQHNKYHARDQVSDGMVKKYFCFKNLCRYVIDNYNRDLQACNCAKEYQLNWAEPRELKGNFLESNSKSPRHSYLPLH